MADVGEELVVIDNRLRFIFFGVECALGISLAPREMERVFHDANADQVSPKEYTFHQSSHLQITGQVDDYEPETICIRVQGKRGSQDLLRRIVEGAEHHHQRMEIARQKRD